MSHPVENLDSEKPPTSNLGVNTMPAHLSTAGATAPFAPQSETTSGLPPDDKDGEGSEEDEESNESDEDMSSELSEGEDLQDELKVALDGENFSFTGTFYHASILTTAPNPCLQISGLGLVGLPLSERDAKCIISCATLAPFGHGERTVIDKSVRDTWEIEPGKITFINPQWEAYVKSTVISEVCKSLGVKIGQSPPRLELYKLLLYEKGSHFLPHQDTQKANGMFATVIIILPSAYTGGQVVVSHASTSKTIDFSSNSLLSTTLLAWYTDVKHEVKEVTSGYRLALSYNLIHDSPNGTDPCPGLPEMNNAVVGLRRVLRKWKEDKYDREGNLIAYLLKHEYSTLNLHHGLKGLKGVDAHRVTFLREVAEELGFVIGLGSLEHKVTGGGDDDGGDYYSRKRYDRWGDYDDDEREDTPGMLEVYETSTTITGLVDLDGNKLISVGHIDVGSDELIPKEPFEGASPDETEYEGYMGNGAGQLEYWYRRTVLVIMPGDGVDDVCFSVEGVPYAYKKLKESNSIPPTQVDRQWANRIMSKDGSLNKEHVATLMDYALKWQDSGMWKNVMKLRSCTLQAVGIPKLLGSWEQFSFDVVRVSFEEILARSTELPERMDFLFQIQAKPNPLEKDAVLAWYKKETQKILSSYNKAAVADIPTIMNIIQNVGLNPFKESVMPNLLKNKDNYEFWIAFSKALRERRQTILDREAARLRPAEQATDADTPSAPAIDDAQGGPAPPLAEAQGATVVDDLITESLQIAALRWSNVQTNSYYYGYRTNPATVKSKVDRIIEIVQEAIAISNLSICRTLFAEVIKSNDQSKTKFDDVYIPVVPRLRVLLAKAQIAMTTPPFIDLFQVLIGLYLRNILGKKPPQRTPLRKVGCGCSECNDLDRFILDPTTSAIQFRLLQARRIHLEQRLAQAPDVCKYSVIRSGRPHGIQVTKHPEIVQAAGWPLKQQAAKVFLASFGPDAVVAQIMGQRFEEVQRAVEGIAPFGFTGATVAAAPAVGGGSRPQPPVAGSSLGTHTPAPSTAAMPAFNAPLRPPQVAGTKRKNLVQLGPVIDLTEDD